MRGSMSSKSHVLTAINQFYPGYHPLVSIAHLAHKEGVDDRLQFDCHRVIAKFVEPELKSLEVTGSFTETRRVTISLFDTDVEDAKIIEPIRLEQSAKISATAEEKTIDEVIRGY